jgi:hypothetical protein
MGAPPNQPLRIFQVRPNDSVRTPQHLFLIRTVLCFSMQGSLMLEPERDWKRVDIALATIDRITSPMKLAVMIRQTGQ